MYTPEDATLDSIFMSPSEKVEGGNQVDVSPEVQQPDITAVKEAS